ncbi:MAG: U32 family peptidase [candidate division KSB1 bacterium]|nr:U32 family peptidase [candidate division KSB1 bacterium]
MNEIELLAPARDLAVGLAAINCGADAVYIGAERFGAREAAGNSLADIEQLVRYAHKFWARVYITLNTILFDAEIPIARKLIHQLYQIGVDGLIIQDVGLLELDLPPIPLIASTQMHNDTVEKVKFWEEVGFQRVILARELSLDQIKDIRRQTNIELEVFIHGALCVCYSGQCYLSYALGGRSGNRGQCAQPCRQKYALLDKQGRSLAPQRYWLSLKDLNQSAHLAELIAAGITSFKIEGRLKDREYVVNIVGHYRRLLDQILTTMQLKKSSSGKTELDFDPDPAKSFQRGFTTYFLAGRDPQMASPETPKSIGEPLGYVLRVFKNFFEIKTQKLLHNGDGICFLNSQQELQGTLVNRVESNRIYPAEMQGIVPGVFIYRNHDHAFSQQLKKTSCRRKIGVTFIFEELPEGFVLKAIDEDQNQAEAWLAIVKNLARNRAEAGRHLEAQFRRLGDTDFYCLEVDLKLKGAYFFSAAVLNALRRKVIQQLAAARLERRPKQQFLRVKNDVPFPVPTLDFRGNVLNQQAMAFYRRHGVTKISPAAEAGADMSGKPVMTTKYCLRQQLNLCHQSDSRSSEADALFLKNEKGQKLRLEFNCEKCQMEIYLEKK